MTRDASPIDPLNRIPDDPEYERIRWALDVVEAHRKPRRLGCSVFVLGPAGGDRGLEDGAVRSGGRLWMVTLDNREPDPFDQELPAYFQTRFAAESYRDEIESWKALGEWPWRDEDLAVVLHAPDDVRKDDIDWDEFA